MIIPWFIEYNQAFYICMLNLFFMSKWITEKKKVVRSTIRNAHFALSSQVYEVTGPFFSTSYLYVKVDYY